MPIVLRILLLEDAKHLSRETPKPVGGSMPEDGYGSLSLLS